MNRVINDDYGRNETHNEKQPASWHQCCSGGVKYHIAYQVVSKIKCKQQRVHHRYIVNNLTSHNNNRFVGIYCELIPDQIKSAPTKI